MEEITVAIQSALGANSRKSWGDKAPCFRTQKAPKPTATAAIPDDTFSQGQMAPAQSVDGNTFQHAPSAIRKHLTTYPTSTSASPVATNPMTYQRQNAIRTVVKNADKHNKKDDKNYKPSDD